MFLRTAIITTTAVAAIGLGAGVAGAAPTASAPPSLAGTSQTLTTQGSDGTSRTATIDFATTTWQLEGYPDSGRYSQTGKKVGLTTDSNANKGCGYTGTYKSRTKIYTGRFKCQVEGRSGTFTLTTQSPVG